MATETVKSKKNKQPKAKKSSPSHPTYHEMIGEAISSMKERTGSSQIAIAKFIEDKHKNQLPPNFKKFLLVQLKKLTAGGKLTKIKNSYKLIATMQKPKPAAVAATGKPKLKVSAKPRVKSPAKPKASPGKKAASTKKKVPASAKPKVKHVKKVLKSPVKRAAPAKKAAVAAKKAKK